MSTRTNRPPRDPAAPKRNMSAYLLYQNAMRDTFKQQNPGMTFGQLSKYTSAMYAEMPQEEKDASDTTKTCVFINCCRDHLTLTGASHC